MAIALWLAFQHKPSWYRPVHLDSEGLQRARRESVAAADDFGDRLVLGEPFEVTLTQQSINEWLFALPETWPQAKDALPPELREPFIQFVPGAVRFAAHVENAVGQAILSIDLGAAVSGDGTSLTVAASAIRGGSLRVPGFLIQRMVSMIKPPSADQDAITIDQLLSGLSTRNRLTWPNGQRPFRIRAITIGHGTLRLAIEPL